MYSLFALGWVSYQIFKNGGLTGSQVLEESAGKEGVTFLAGGGRDHSFYVKNKLKSEILNDEKKLQTKMLICYY